LRIINILIKMKKIITLFLLLFSLSSFGQTLPYFPPRTPVLGSSPKVIQDRDLRAIKTFWLPYTNSTTPVLLSIDSAGSNVQLLNNGNLAVSSGLGAGFRQYVPSSVLATTYQPLIISTTDLSFRDLTSTGDVTFNQTSGKGTFGFNYMGLGVVNAGSAASLKNKFTSKGNTIGSLTGGTGLFMAGSSGPNNTTSIRPEISFYRGANAYPEGGIREHTSSDLGFELFAGNGTIAPIIIAKGEYGAVKSTFVLPVNTNLNMFDLTGSKAVFTDASRNITTTGTSDLITEGTTNLYYTSARSALKADLASPTFTGTPTLPTGAIVVTQAATDNSTKIASTAFVVGATKEIVLNKTVNYVVLVADFANTGKISLYVDATSGNLNITLPSVAGMLGYTLNVFKTDVSANTVTITGVSANINGASTKVLSSQYSFTEIHSNNTQYYAK
jgi:hypothetical protein